MADRLEDLLRACTVQVVGGPMSGAGFFIAPGKVLTCAHVIGDSQNLMVRWERDDHPALEAPVSRRGAVIANRGRPIPALDQEYPDVAVLEVDGIDGHPCVAIDPDWPSQEDVFQLFGYPSEGGAVQLTPARLTYRGTHGTLPTAYLDLASDTIKPGMSGAALLNLRTGAVCGVVVASKDPARPDGALAVPWSAVVADLSPIMTANRAFQLRDRRWDTAAEVRRNSLRFRLPRVVAHFTGRDDLLTQIHFALNQRSTGVITQAISGLGGVGKTQLAVAYVQAHYEEFDIVAWVRGEDGGVADLADLAVAIALPVTGRTPPERARDVLVYLANTDRSWLLVFDNASGPEALADLPFSGHGRVLVTSRHRGGYETFGVELPVDVFDPDTARRYLMLRSGRTNEEASNADTVAAVLGYLPLALAHAGAYCASDTGVSFRDYLELLDLPSQNLFDASPELYYQRTVAATWNASISAAGQVAPLARRALEMMVYLAPEAMPRSFFSALEEETAVGRKLVADALTALHRYSLATVTGSRVSVHRLLQKVIRDRLGDDERAAAAAYAVTAVYRALPADPRLPATWPQWQELIPHVTALAHHDVVASRDAAGLMAILNPATVFLSSAGLLSLAVDLAARGVAVSTAYLDTDSPTTLSAQGNLSLCYQMAGHVREAIAIQEQVALDRERLQGLDHPDTISARAALASSYASAGRVGEAIAIQERVAADRETLLNHDHPDTLAAWSDLASSYELAGHTSEAIAIQAQVAADRERVLGLDHPDTLTAWGDLATSYELAGQVSVAIGIQERVVVDRERLLGGDHPDTLSAQAGLARSYHAAGRTGEAIGIQERVAADRERLLGPDHPDTLASWGDLASSYQSAGRTPEAIATQQRLTADRERLLGPDHPDTLASWGDLASSYQSAGRTDEAIAIQQRLTAMRGRLVRADEPDEPASVPGPDSRAVAYANEGDSLCGQRRYADAETAYRAAIAMSPGLARAIAGLGKSLYGLRRYAEAEAASREAIQLDPYLVRARSDLGDILTRLERYSEAAAIYHEAARLPSINSVGETAPVAQAIDAQARQLEVVGVRIEQETNQPLVLLKEKHGNRYLSVKATPVEALSIAKKQSGISQNYALTDNPGYAVPHDLLCRVLTVVGVPLSNAIIVGFIDGMFYADLTLSNGEKVHARAPDAIALAIEAGLPLFGAAAVLGEVGLTLPHEDPAAVTTTEARPKTRPSLPAAELPATYFPSLSSATHMEVVGVRVEVSTNRPAALLKERNGSRYLIIWISAAEGVAIAIAQDGYEDVSGVTLTHNLFYDLLKAANVEVLTGSIARFRGGTLTISTDQSSTGLFFCDLGLSGGTRIRASAGDVLALALKAGAAILVAADVVDAAAISNPD